jgi:hypothetical protein
VILSPSSRRWLPRTIRWIEGAQVLSLPLVTDLLRRTGKQMDMYYASMDLYDPPPPIQAPRMPTNCGTRAYRRREGRRRSSVLAS